MQKKYIYLLITATIIIAMFVVSSWYYIRQHEQLGEQGTATEISLRDVEKHNKTDDCWIVVGAKVYSVTRYIAAHPESTTYSAWCGKNVTEIITANAPSQESSKIYDQLGPYYIGIVSP